MIATNVNHVRNSSAPLYIVLSSRIEEGKLTDFRIIGYRATEIMRTHLEQMETMIDEEKETIVDFSLRTGIPYTSCDYMDVESTDEKHVCEEIYQHVLFSYELEQIAFFFKETKNILAWFPNCNGVFVSIIDE